MPDTPHVLVSGGGIAGPALACLLGRRGWRITVVERAEGPRDEGQNIDVRGAARDVLHQMGLHEAVRARHTGERGTRFVDRRGRTVAEFPASGSDGGPTAELEILRGQLSEVLVEAGRDDVEYRYGDRITALDDRADGVAVTFRSGPPRTVDLVVIADGVHSATRDLVFDADAVRELGLYLAYLTIPRAGTDEPWWRWHVAGRGRGVTLRPDNVGTTRAMLNVISDVRGLADLDRADQVHVLRRTFADVGWEAPRVLAAMDDAPLYVEAVGQTRLESWSRGRVALLGDAAYCAAPVSGMSTSLALVGAYVLAGELLRAPGDHRRAFGRYETVMRPYVGRAQRLPPGVPRVANPRGRAGRTALHTALRVAASPAATRLGVLSSPLLRPPADAFTLPDHPSS